MTTFIVVCGTSGAGKTYVTQRLIDEHGLAPVPSAEMSPPLTGCEGPYAHVGGNVCVAGRYNTGLEHGSSGDEKNRLFAELLQRCAARADVVVTQGLTVGKSNVIWERVRELVPGARVVFAYLDTPQERCIENVYLRRTRSVHPRTTPLKENAIRQDWRSVRNQRARFATEGRNVRDISHLDPLADLVRIVREEGGNL